MNLRKIDALVEYALGWISICEIHGKMTGRMPVRDFRHDYPSPLPHYTTDWAAAGQVVEWIASQEKFYFELYNDALGHSFDLIPIRLEDEADLVCGDRAPTAPLAICLAFLAAMGVEVGE